MDPDELAEARADAAALLNQQAVRTRIESLPGQKSRTGADRTQTVRASLACRIRQPAKQRRVQVGDQDQRQLDAEGVFAYGSDVQAGDQVRVEGVTYHVVGTDAGRANATALIAALMRSGQPAPSPLPER